MANEENIVAHRFKAGDEARENGSKGGKASGEARRRKRALKEAADLYLSLTVSDKRIRNRIARAGVDPEDIDNQMAIIAGLSRKAMEGDSKAARTLFELLGEDYGRMANESAIESFLQAMMPKAGSVKGLYEDEEGE